MLIRKSNERGFFDHGWLKTWHSFSFADYYDEKFTNFSVLRVINEDIVAPSSGFPTHPHKNMEILTYVLSGAVAHKDSMGNITQLNAGEFQIMSAGTGILHSEYNPSSVEALHLYQIWVIPQRLAITPRYEQGKIEYSERIKGMGCECILHPENQGIFKVNQDMSLHRYSFDLSDQTYSIKLDPKRSYWLQMIKGNCIVNNEDVLSSDGIAFTKENELIVTIPNQSESAIVEFLLFDLP